MRLKVVIEMEVGILNGHYRSPTVASREIETGK